MVQAVLAVEGVVLLFQQFIKLEEVFLKILWRLVLYQLSRQLLSRALVTILLVAQILAANLQEPLPLRMLEIYAVPEAELMLSMVRWNL